MRTNDIHPYINNRYSNETLVLENDNHYFSEDKKSWDIKKDDTTENSGTEGNDWDANNPIERNTDYRYDDEDREAISSDYINCDRSDYNRDNVRFRWSPEDWD